ncbi:MAG: glycoside hydrolase family 3 N-terminal domain-containing protein [Solirubrobacteraceae bacterium]
MLTPRKRLYGERFRRSLLALALAGASIASTGCGTATKTTTNASLFTTPAILTTQPSRQTTTATRAEPSQHLRPKLKHTRTLGRALGQLIIARFDGPSPSTAFLTRIRMGQIGGVILFADNVLASPSDTRTLIDELQAAAAAGSNPPLLIMTDQEGGEVKRLPWAPPALSPLAMTSVDVAHAEGLATGRALRSIGVNVDLAPVADVKRVAGSFLGTRSFGTNSVTVGARACAFAEGLASEGVAFTLKHFPGLGRASTSTDEGPATIGAPASSLRGDYGAYRRCGADRGALVMISSASYPGLTGTSDPAVTSPEIYRNELPLATGSQPVTISDDLQAGAFAGIAAPAEQAINAGLDLLLYAQTESGSASAFARLRSVARSGGITLERLQRAEQTIYGLKELVANAPPAPQGSPSRSEETANPEELGAPETVQPEVQPNGR